MILVCSAVYRLAERHRIGVKPELSQALLLTLSRLLKTSKSDREGILRVSSGSCYIP